MTRLLLKFVSSLAIPIALIATVSAPVAAASGDTDALIARRQALQREESSLRLQTKALAVGGTLFFVGAAVSFVGGIAASATVIGAAFALVAPTALVFAADDLAYRRESDFRKIASIRRDLQRIDEVLSGRRPASGLNLERGAATNPASDPAIHSASTSAIGVSR